MRGRRQSAKPKLSYRKKDSEMATAGKLAEIIADATGLALPKVRKTMHTLHVARFLTTGARGVNAPDMTPRDASLILTALLLSDHPVDAVRAAEDASRLFFVKAVPAATPKASIFDFALDIDALRNGEKPDCRNFFGAFEYVLTTLAATKSVASKKSSFVQLTFNNSDLGCQIETGNQTFRYAMTVPQVATIPKLNEKGQAELRVFQALRATYFTSKMIVARTWPHETIFMIAQAFKES